MSKHWRESLAWLHAWAGLVAGWLLFAILLTGSLAVFAPEITRWMQPQVTASSASPAQAVATAQLYLQRHASAAESWAVDLPSPRQPYLRLSWIAGFDEDQVVVDMASGAAHHMRATEGGDFFNRVHYELHAGMLGLWIVGLAGLVLLVTALSGVIIHRRLFVDLFTFRPRAASQRSWLDGHNVVGVFTLPFLLMIAYTGVSMSFTQFMPAGVEALYAGDRGATAAALSNSYQRPPLGQGAPIPDLPALLRAAEVRLDSGKVAHIAIDHPGDQAATFTAYRRTDDRVAALSAHVTLQAADGKVLSSQGAWPSGAVFHRTLAGLHFGAFGGYVVAWLYFLSGLSGCVVVAAGLTVFIEKRRKKRAAAAPLDRRFQVLAERVNVAAVAGVMLAAVAFFWGDRLIPVDLRMREDWESRIFFITWLVALVHALARPPHKAWVEQLAATAALCLALPLLNAASGGQALWRSIARQDWAVAGVDLTSLGLGLCLCAVTARIAGRREAS